jgi:hypothetical protein
MMVSVESAKKRKDAHSAIEKRRRLKTNAVLAELKSILPNCANKEMPKLGIILIIQEILEECLKVLKDCNKIAVPVSPRNSLSSSSSYIASDSDSGDANDKMQIHNLLSY